MFETRAFGEPLELRSDASTPGTLIGYAAVFDKPANDRFVPREVIRRGAFDKVLASGQDIVALVEHDPHRLIGRSAAGTLRLRTDEHGLRTEIDLPDTTLGHDVAASVGRGDLRGQSFAFAMKRSGQRFTRGADGQPQREILEVERIRDVGPAVFPVYPDTSVAMRGFRDWEAACDRRARLRRATLRLVVADLG